MPGRYPCGGMNRRNFLGALAAPVLASAVVSAQEAVRKTRSPVPAGTLGVPGPYPGRVVEVRNPALISKNQKDRAAVRATLNTGTGRLDRRRPSRRGLASFRPAG